jgi:hypothetical protein
MINPGLTQVNKVFLYLLKLHHDHLYPCWHWLLQSLWQYLSWTLGLDQEEHHLVSSLITFVRLNSEIISNQILRKDRNCFGGGVLVYTSQDICVKPRYDLNFASGEIIWYEVIIPNFNLPQNNFYLSLIFDQKTHQLIYPYQLYLYLSGFL